MKETRMESQGKWRSEEKTASQQSAGLFPASLQTQAERRNAYGGEVQELTHLF